MAEEKQESQGMSAASEYVQIFMIDVQIKKAENLKKADVFGKSDPYCRCTAFGQTYTTETIMKTLDPVWNESTTFVFFADPGKLNFQIFDWDRGTKDDPIGDVDLSLNGFFEEGHKGFDGKLTLQNIKTGEIFVSVQCRKLVPSELEERARQLAEETEQQKTKILNLQTSITDTTQSNERLTNENTNLKIAIDENKETVSNLEQDIQARQANQAELKEELNTVENDKKQAETERDDAKKEMEESNRQVEKLLNELEKIKTENDNLNHDSMNLQKDIKNKKDELARQESAKAEEERRKKTSTSKKSTSPRGSGKTPGLLSQSDDPDPSKLNSGGAGKCCCIVL